MWITMLFGTLIAVVLAVLVGFVSSIFGVLLHNLIAELLGPALITSSASAWITVISGGLVAIVLNILLIVFLYIKIENNDFNFLRNYWDDKRITVSQGVIALLPVLAIAVGFAIYFVLSFNGIAEKIISLAQIKTGESPNTNVLIYLSGAVGAILTLLAYFIFISLSFEGLSCAYCRTIGCIDYELVSEKVKSGLDYRSKTRNEKIASIKVDGYEVGSVSGDITRTSVYDVQTTNKSYEGKCRACGNLNKKNAVFIYKKRIY